MELITRKRAVERAQRLKEFNEGLYGVKFDLLEERLPLEGLVPTQGELSEVKLLVVLQEIKHGYDAPIIVLRYRGRDYILDGHHRAYALWKLGFGTVEALVLVPGGEIESRIAETTEKSGLSSLKDIKIVRD
ncbi:ParB/RepB/Spo0J family partition protein [Palaeococcus ferrophilus]|uniref:ParB/RepB/Spo0J family partition protein n=1 Tax=Palaeococcus ferrophilus TaxID=83868 RepID=UPI00064F4FB0|nr:ParB/RepB/Spo0J family partition protein [Palaeococcus ferrophilus]